MHFTDQGGSEYSLSCDQDTCKRLETGWLTASRAVSKFFDDALSPREIEYSIDQGGSEYLLSLDGDPDKRLDT